MNKNLIKASLLIVLTMATLGGCGTEAIAAPKVANIASRSAERQANQDTKMNLLKTRAENEITRRLTTLNNLVNGLNNAQKLTSQDKSTLTTQVNDEISGLNILKTKIDGDTDIAVLRTDVQSIARDYRVYLLIVPKIRIIIATDRISSIADVINGDLPTIQNAIHNAQSKGQDVTALQAKLSDMQTKVLDAKSQISSVNSAVINLTPDQYNANHGLLTGPINNLKTARQDLITARTDFRNIYQALAISSVNQ